MVSGSAIAILEPETQSSTKQSNLATALALTEALLPSINIFLTFSQLQLLKPEQSIKFFVLKEMYYSEHSSLTKIWLNRLSELMSIVEKCL